MTAYPDPGILAELHSADPLLHSAGRPRVTEHYWGYEIAPGEVALDMALIRRKAAVFLAACLGLAGLGIWLMPAMAFIGQAFLGKAALSAGLVALAVIILAAALPGRRVRLQVDRSNGELREVVRSLTGGETVLATYGFDAAQAVSLQTGEDRSQLQIKIDGVGHIPAGDGHVVCLMPLKTRLESDLGIGADNVGTPDFAGPLVR